MRYKRIPAPPLAGDEEKRPLYRKDGDVFVIGWEIGHMAYRDPLAEHTPEEPRTEWEKLREVTTLLPEQEAEWQREQETLPPAATEEMRETADAAYVDAQVALALAGLL